MGLDWRTGGRDCKVYFQKGNVGNSLGACANCAARRGRRDLRVVAKLSGTVAWAAPQSLPNDGKVIADERG